MASYVASHACTSGSSLISNCPHRPKSPTLCPIQFCVPRLYFRFIMQHVIARRRHDDEAICISIRLLSPSSQKSHTNIPFHFPKKSLNHWIPTQFTHICSHLRCPPEPFTLPPGTIYAVTPGGLRFNIACFYFTCTFIICKNNTCWCNLAVENFKAILFPHFSIPF